MSEAFAATYGPWAIVAGASEGLGAAFAEGLARRGLNLLLLARRAELLDAVAAKLGAPGVVHVRTAACDLADPDLDAQLESLTRTLEVGLVVYNAAYAPVGPFLEQSPEALLRVVDVNIRAPLLFARRFAPAMVERKRGGLVFMSSMAGFQGAPRISTYAASKAFNTVLGEGLWAELAPKGVHVLVPCAGAVRTPNYLKSTPREAPGTLEASEVVEASLDALRQGPTLVPGLTNRLGRFVLGRLLTRRGAISLMGKNTKDLV
jgi:short-subunit dehydrogenase